MHLQFDVMGLFHTVSDRKYFLQEYWVPLGGAMASGKCCALQRQTESLDYLVLRENEQTPCAMFSPGLLYPLNYIHLAETGMNFLMDI